MGQRQAGSHALMSRAAAIVGALIAVGAAWPAFAFQAAPGTNTAPVEIPRPSRAWAPEGEPPTPEMWKLRTMGGPGTPGRSLVPEYATACNQFGDDGFTDAELLTNSLPQIQTAWRGLLAVPGVRGSIQWDRRTGLPHRAWVSGLRVAGGPIEPAARAFVREHASLILAGETASDDDLPLLKAHRVGQVWFLVFGQRWHGLEVIDGRIDLRDRKSTRLNSSHLGISY